MIIRDKIAFLGITALLLGACTHDRGNTGPQTQAETVEETRVFFEKQCLAEKAGEAQSGILGALLVAGASAVIDVGIDAIGAALKEAAEPKTETKIARQTGHFHALSRDGLFKSNNDLKCLIVVHGQFHLTKPTEAKKDGYGFEVNTAALGMAASPAFYMEAEAEYGIGGRIFRYRPVYLAYNKHLGSGMGRENRDILITVAFGPPAADGNSKAVAMAKFEIKDIEPPYVRTKSQLAEIGQHRAMDFGWMPVIAPDSSSEALASAMTRGDTDIQATLAKYAGLADAKQEIYDRISTEVFNQVLVPFATARATAQREAALQQQKDEYNADSMKLVAELAKLQDTQNTAKQIEAKQAQLAQLKKIEALQKQNAAAAPSMAPILGETLERMKADQVAILELGKPKQAGQDFAIAATPLNIAVTLTETRNASKLLTFLNSVFEKAKPELKTAAKGLLPESDAAQETKLGQQETAAISAIRSTQAYEVAVAELAALNPAASATERLKAEHKVSMTRVEANVARRKAGLPPL